MKRSTFLSVFTVPVIILLLLLMFSCAGTPRYEWKPAPLGREVPVPEGVTLFSFTNRVETGGVSISFPGAWRVHRPLPVLEQSSDEAQAGQEPAGEGSRILAEGMPLLFELSSRQAGWFRSFSFDGPVSPREFFILYLDRMVPEEAAVELEEPKLDDQGNPQAEGGKRWYQLRWYYGEMLHTTAVWFGRKGFSAYGPDPTQVFVLDLQRNPANWKGKAEFDQSEDDSLPQPPDGVRTEQQSIFFSVQAVSPRLSGRHQPWNSLRFLSSSGWQWISDLQDGMLLSGTVAGREALAELQRSRYLEGGPAELLGERYKAGPGQAEESGSVTGRFLIDNRPVEAEGAWSRDGEGRLYACYLLPKEVEDGPWFFTLSIGPPDSAGNPGQSSSLDPATLHQLPSIRDLFERQLFFGRQEASL